ncbi:uncharacterized protein I206_102784 [Kwoniella pini CBS 10737]|uniref:Bud22 domain-containing protein n=1 Tax=Kwoniella pini CBS 10737 TaxID=1296096 RepID=A0A1B9I6C6_9TREE|nr:uncharacterized protein I206_03139 [Kwoniella pini CBS 10737]OCF51073.1 hypothetical protein I206_03139 [Kwoniella pini CBS 10737]
MSAPLLSNDPAQPVKKRKRTGKEREERKRLAIQAQSDAEKVEKVAEDPLTTESTSEIPLTVSDEPEIKKDGVDIEKATKRIPQALKSLHPTFKQAKSFETRRLIKKIKFLRIKPDIKAEVSDLEAQLSILHDIQLHPLAQSHLLLKLRKHPLFKSTTLPNSITEILISNIPSVPSTSTSATPTLIAKVENRLYSEKGVAETVKGVVSWIIGEEGAKLIQQSKKESKSSNNPIVKGSKKSQIKNQVDDSDAEINEDDSDIAIEGGKEMVIASDDEFAEISDEDELAVDEAGWESGSISGSGNDSENDEDEDSIPIPPSKKVKSTPVPTPKVKSTKLEKMPKDGKAVTSSMFLPSLATGFTLGDEGDSDPDEDFDPNGVIGKKTIERKNRRGQRARQAIWEKKYGKGAKHVVKAKEDEESYQAIKAKREADRRGKPDHMRGKDRDNGWGTKSGNLNSTPSFNISSNSSRNVPSIQSNPQPKDDKKNLHPSWEAARLRKQKMGAVPSDAPKANKIVFD